MLQQVLEDKKILRILTCCSSHKSWEESEYTFTEGVWVFSGCRYRPSRHNINGFCGGKCLSKKIILFFTSCILNPGEISERPDPGAVKIPSDCTIKLSSASKGKKKIIIILFQRHCSFKEIHGFSVLKCCRLPSHHIVFPAAGISNAKAKCHSYIVFISWEIIFQGFSQFPPWR